MAVQPGDQPVFLGRSLCLCIDLAALHAAIDELTVLPGGIDASSDSGDRRIGPSGKGEAWAELIAVHLNISACQELRRAHLRAVRLHRPFGVGSDGHAR